MNAKKPYPHLLRAGQVKGNESTFSHPWNPHSEITGTHMSRIAGLALDKRMLRLGGRIEIHRLSEGESFFAPLSEVTK
jgi:hypothetical protein